MFYNLLNRYKYIKNYIILCILNHISDKIDYLNNGTKLVRYFFADDIQRCNSNITALIARSINIWECLDRDKVH